MGRLPTNFAPIDTSLFSDTKVRGVSPAAKLIYVASLLDSNRQMTDGQLQRHDVAFFAGQVGVKASAHKQLVEVGLWRETATGFEIVGFKDHNYSREQRKKAAAAAAERKETYRVKHPKNGVRNGVLAAFPTRSEQRKRTEGEKETEAEQAAMAGSAS